MSNYASKIRSAGLQHFSKQNSWQSFLFWFPQRKNRPFHIISRKNHLYTATEIFIFDTYIHRRAAYSTHWPLIFQEYFVISGKSQNWVSSLALSRLLCRVQFVNCLIWHVYLKQRAQRDIFKESVLNQHR